MEINNSNIEEKFNKDLPNIINYYNEINNMYYQTKQLSNNLDLLKKNIQKNIYKLCDHDWITDNSYYDEKTTFICSKCNLYKNKYLYN